MAVTTAARITQLETLIGNIDEILLEITQSPKPTYTVDAQRFEWKEYFEMLTEKRAELLAEYDALVDMRDGTGFEMAQGFVEN
jgi:hypothetical protein